MRLQPRVQPFEQAVEAYRFGRLGATLDGVRGNLTQAARSLSARALLRLSQNEAALAAVAAIDDTVSHGARAEAYMQRGEALARLARFDESERAYDTARVFMLATACTATAAEFESHRAVRWFMLGQGSEAEDAAYRVFSYERDPSENDTDYFVPIAHSRARAFQVLAFLEARRERYAEQSAFLYRAVGELDCEKTPDVWQELVLLNALGTVVRELGLEAETNLLRERLAREWPPEAVGFRFNVLRSLGMASVLRGDHIGALRDLRSAAEFAPSPVLRLAATLDRASLARELHQSIMAREELDYAERLSSQIDWATSMGEERHVLLLLTEALSYRSADRARRALERYRGIKTKLLPGLLGTADRRWRADEAFSEAKVLRAEGETERAAVFFAEAFRIWDSIGYRWRAALAALELAEMGAEPNFAEYARKEARRMPNSWLAQRVSRLARADNANES